MKHEEENLQIACVEWFKLQYPKIFIHHSPNGGKRNIREAARLKKMGVCAGFPDLMIIAPGRPVLFIEMKSAKGKVTAKQIEVLKKLRDCGHEIDGCNTFEEFVYTVNEFLK